MPLALPDKTRKKHKEPTLRVYSTVTVYNLTEPCAIQKEHNPLKKIEDVVVQIVQTRLDATSGFLHIG